MFPPEIFSEIFSFLAEARVLIACSQAHPVFAQLIEPRLYAHVLVHNHHADDVVEDEHYLKFKPHQLSALLSDNPRILNYLRSLCVDLFRFYPDNEATKEIIPILPGLKLERIELTLSHGVSNWQWSHITLHTAFVACISTPFMKEICITNVYDIHLSSFADCAGLKRLTLWNDVLPQSNNSFDFPHLETLELCYWTMDRHSYDEFFSWLLIHACGLRSLTLATTRKNVMRTFLPRLLAICSTSLVNLSIYYTALISDAAPIQFDFPGPGLRSLERLHICTCIRNSDNYTVRHALVTITQILQNLSSLKQLTLVLCLRYSGRDVPEVDWSPLADFLSDRHSSFQHTDLYIRTVKGDGEVSFDKAISLLSRYENLMSLVEAGYVSIKEEMDPDVFKKYL